MTNKTRTEILNLTDLTAEGGVARAFDQLATRVGQARHPQAKGAIAAMAHTRSLIENTFCEYDLKDLRLINPVMAKLLLRMTDETTKRVLSPASIHIINAIAFPEEVEIYSFIDNISAVGTD